MQLLEVCAIYIGVYILQLHLIRKLFFFKQVFKYVNENIKYIDFPIKNIQIFHSSSLLLCFLTGMHENANGQVICVTWPISKDVEQSESSIQS